MIIIKMDNITIDRALRILKSKVNKTKLIKELRDRQEFKKPSVIKREQKKKAIYSQKFKDEE
jgi:small subunit ribosomal protein S21